MSKLRPLLLPQMIEARRRLSSEADSCFSASCSSLITQDSSYTASVGLPSPVTPTSVWFSVSPENKQPQQATAGDSAVHNTERSSKAYSPNLHSAPILRSYSSYEHLRKDNQQLPEVKEEREVEDMFLQNVYPGLMADFYQSAFEINKTPLQPPANATFIAAEAEELDKEPYSAWSDEEQPKRRRLRKRRTSDAGSVSRSSIFGTRMSQRLRTFPMSRRWRDSRVSLASGMGVPTPDDSPSSGRSSVSYRRDSVAPPPPSPAESDDEEDYEQEMHLTLPATRYDPHASRKNRADDSTRTPLLPPSITENSGALNQSYMAYPLPLMLPERNPPPNHPPPPIPTAAIGVAVPDSHASKPVRASVAGVAPPQAQTMTPPPSPPGAAITEQKKQLVQHYQKNQRDSHDSSHRSSASASMSRSSTSSYTSSSIHAQGLHKGEPQISSDPWALLLGHANFTIHPQPYTPSSCTITTLKRLRADWDTAKRNFDHHLHLTSEHHGPDSDLCRISRWKWSALDKQWGEANKIVIDGIINDTVAKQELASFCVSEREIENFHAEQAAEQSMQQQLQRLSIAAALPPTTAIGAGNGEQPQTPPDSPPNQNSLLLRLQKQQQLQAQQLQRRRGSVKKSGIRTRVRAWWR